MSGPRVVWVSLTEYADAGAAVMAAMGGGFRFPTVPDGELMVVHQDGAARLAVGVTRVRD